MAIAFFKHTPVGKKTQAQPYTTAAHARYAMRKSAAMRVFTERMPLNWHAVQRFLKQHEDGLRVNGRVADKFIIAVPREFTMEAAEKVLRAYGNRIGKEKAPFLVAFHWDDHNPHAHMIFIDRDPETGRRVFGTSEKGSTELLKIEWQSEVNAMFQELGMDNEIQFGGRLEAVNDNASEPSPTETAVVEEPTLEELDNDLGRVDYQEELEAELEGQVPVIEQEGVSRYKQAFSAAQELRRIRQLQAERNEIKTRYESAYAAHQQSEASSKQALTEYTVAKGEAALAERAMIEEHSTLFGNKKGFKFSLMGYSYVSPARRAAEAAEESLKLARVKLTVAEQSARREQANFQLVSEDYERATYQYQQIQGDDNDLAEAEEIYENTFNQNAGDLTPEQVKDLVMENEIDPAEAKLILETLGYQEEAREIER